MPQATAAKPAPGAFFDSDFRTLEPLLALGILYGLQSRNECRVTTVSLSRPNLAVAGFIDAVQRYYRAGGNFGAPVGMRTAGDAGDTPGAFAAPFEKKNPDGTPALVNRLRSVIDTGDPATIIRNYLQAQQDDNAVIIAAGPASDLAALLDLSGIEEWIRAKVSRLVISTVPTHVRADLAATRKVLARWPGPLVALGEEIGAALPFSGATLLQEFAAKTPESPIAAALRSAPGDAPAGALAAALYALRPKAEFFSLSDPGTLKVDGAGSVAFEPSAAGKHRRLLLNAGQKEKLLNELVQLAANAKPAQRPRFRPPVEKPPEKPAEKPADKPSDKKDKQP